VKRPSVGWVYMVLLVFWVQVRIRR
jgi:hypothetical protein